MKKRLLGPAVLLAVPIAIVALSIGPSEAATTPVDGGIYTIASGASGKCIDVTGAGTGNGALLVQIACNTAAGDQQFRAVAQNGAFGLVNANSGKCADVPYSSTTTGTQLWQWTCGAGANQTWSLTASTAAAGKFLIKSAVNGLCVSDKDGSTAGNNPIVQEACSDIARMQWSFNQVSGSAGWSNTADGFAQGTTGGAGGTTVTVSSYADLLKYATASAAYVVKVNGTITVPTYGYEIPVTSN
ncbi:hypothetical protein Q0Z83_009080 [Actinoplanes sichuanensis]|uniref:RICIN domain-containing protein n=1 Tax=Actinoplanes sichuanensis TaxID=512349 RepID=A0ABW4AFE1_9ACTN|nr:RICIN domain-containing protein [Actinoplanes sichuanensis]BEL02717.1 hypothetical protein Q0Z83_009080 [Actinoplanes sichuanensis]